MSSVNQRLVYFLAETHLYSQGSSVLVVNLVSPLSPRNDHVFQECLEHVSQCTAKWIVLNFRDVPMPVHESYFQHIQQLKRIAHARSARLCFSAVHPELKPALLTRELASPDEIYDNLRDVFEAIPAVFPKSA